MAEFNATKLISILIRNEGKAADLYNNLAKQMKEGAGEKVFKILAEDEINHARINSELLKKVEKSQPAEITTEDFEYLESLIVNDMFSDGKKPWNSSRQNALKKKRCSWGKSWSGMASSVSLN